MKYVSTRGEAPASAFSDILLAGLASDGGLYVPDQWPVFSRDDIADLAGQPFHDAAFRIVRPFVGDAIADDDLGAMCRDAYAGFDHPAVAPLVQVAPGHWILELFHGPTLAFKDVAMQLLARLMDHVLAERRERVTIVGATSGDTGAAAVEAFSGRDNADVFILFPRGRIAPIQQRQMTTTGADNVHVCAIDGTFDDCQRILKAMFGNAGFRERVRLAGVNSINWARILGQITYYFTAAVALGAPGRAISFTVPTGNFGDIYAGHVARRMGLPIDRLTIASNANDILTRAVATGRYELRPVVATTSPSMDIQVSSNFERLLFEAVGGEAATIRAMMAGLAQSGAFEIAAEALTAIRTDFDAGRASEEEAADAARTLHREAGYLADPHTAVGLSVARRFGRRDTPMVTLATAHPAKFPDAVAAATGVKPELPARLQHILTADERLEDLPNDVAAVEAFVAARSRAALEGATL